MADSCICRNEHLGSIRDLEFLDKMNDFNAARRFLLHKVG
jgi:hypothetical protein